MSAPTARWIDGRLVIFWPDPRPDSFLISSEAFEQIVAQLNANRVPQREPKDYECGYCTWHGPNPVHVHYEDHTTLKCPNCWHQVGRQEWQPTTD